MPGKHSGSGDPMPEVRPKDRAEDSAVAGVLLGGESRRRPLPLQTRYRGD